MEPFDKILLAILIFSLILKYSNNIIIYILLKNKTIDKSKNKKCIHLKLNGANQCCEHDYFAEKFFTGNQCNKEKCYGYKTSNFSINDLKKSNIWWTVLTSIINTTADLSPVILVIRALIMK